MMRLKRIIIIAISFIMIFSCGGRQKKSDQNASSNSPGQIQSQDMADRYVNRAFQNVLDIYINEIDSIHNLYGTQPNNIIQISIEKRNDYWYVYLESPSVYSTLEYGYFIYGDRMVSLNQIDPEFPFTFIHQSNLLKDSVPQDFNRKGDETYNSISSYDGKMLRIESDSLWTFIGWDIWFGSNLGM